MYHKRKIEQARRKYELAQLKLQDLQFCAYDGNTLKRLQTYYQNTMLAASRVIDYHTACQKTCK